MAILYMPSFDAYLQYVYTVFARSIAKNGQVKEKERGT
jgi:hypothetical protein